MCTLRAWLLHQKSSNSCNQSVMPLSAVAMIGALPFHSNESYCVAISFTKMNGNSRDILRLRPWQLLRAAAAGRTLRLVEPFHFRGCDHATDQASFDAKTHKQNHRRQCAGCRRTGFLAGR